MAGSTKADAPTNLEQRVHELERATNTNKGVAIAVMVIVPTLLTAIGTAIWQWYDHGNKITQHDTKIVAIEKSQEKDFSTAEKNLDRLEKRFVEHRESRSVSATKSFAQANLASVSGALSNNTAATLYLEINGKVKAFGFARAECIVNGQEVTDWRFLVGLRGKAATVWLSAVNPMEVALMEIEDRKPFKFK